MGLFLSFSVSLLVFNADWQCSFPRARARVCLCFQNYTWGCFACFRVTHWNQITRESWWNEWNNQIISVFCIDTSGTTWIRILFYKIFRGIWRRFSLSFCPPGRVWHEMSDFHLSQLICSWACLTWGIWRCLSLSSGLLWLEISVVYLPVLLFLAVSDMRYLMFLSRLPVLLGLFWHEVIDVSISAIIMFLIVPDMRYLTLLLAQLYASWSCLTWGIWRYFSLSYMHPDRASHEVSDVVSVLAIYFLALSDMRYLTFPSQPYAS